MTRPSTTALLLVAALVVCVFDSPAAAQNDAAIDVSPATVDTSGTYEFRVTGTGWTDPSPYFVVPCALPDTGHIADVDTDTCESDPIEPATVDTAGALTATIVVDVTTDGVVILAVNGDQSQIAGRIIVPADAPVPTGDELPATGGPSRTISFIALVLLGAGTLLVGATRRF